MMPKTRVPYSPEFRRQMVDLARAGRDPDDLAHEFEPTAQSIRNWIVQADKKEGRREDSQDLVKAGIPMLAVMQAGGWKTSAMPASYNRAQEAQTGGMAMLAEKQEQERLAMLAKKPGR